MDALVDLVGSGQRRMLIGILTLVAFAAGPGGGLTQWVCLAAAQEVGDSADTETTSDQERPLYAGDVNAFAEAARRSVMMVAFGFLGIMLVAFAMAYVLVYSPRELYTIRPFDPKRDRKKKTDEDDEWLLM